MLSLPDCTDLEQIDLWDEADEDIRNEYHADYFRFDEEEEAAEVDYGSEADDEPLPETRILRPWHQNKATGPWGPKGPKAKRITLRSHRTGR